MSLGVLNAAMLLGLAGAALPVIIHLLNRRRVPVIDWGAMQFLEPGRQSRRRIRLAEVVLMLARMSLLTIVALALARPFWAQPAESRGSSGRARRDRPAARFGPGCRYLRKHGAGRRRLAAAGPRSGLGKSVRRAPPAGRFG